MVLICGLPNAGKTTHSDKYFNVVHFDDISYWRADDHFEKCNALVTKSIGDVCVEGVYNTAKRRQELLEVCNKNYKKCIWIDTPVEICLQRERNGRMRGDHLVLHHAKTFEPPTLDEGWDEIIIIRGDYEQRINRQTED